MISNWFSFMLQLDTQSRNVTSSSPVSAPSIRASPMSSVVKAMAAQLSTTSWRGEGRNQPVSRTRKAPRTASRARADVTTLVMRKVDLVLLLLLSLRAAGEQAALINTNPEATGFWQ